MEYGFCEFDNIERSRRERSDAAQLFNEESSKTLDEFREECDINTILSRFEKDQILEHVNRFQGRYEDLSDVQDYHSSLNQVLAAQEAFNTLPATLRTRFDNDPGKFLAFVADDENMDEMRQMGLLPDDLVTSGQGDAPKAAEPVSAST